MLHTHKPLKNKHYSFSVLLYYIQYTFCLCVLRSQINNPPGGSSLGEVRCAASPDPLMDLFIDVISLGLNLDEGRLGAVRPMVMLLPEWTWGVVTVLAAAEKANVELE